MIALCKDFLDVTPKAQLKKGKMESQTCKNWGFCSQKILLMAWKDKLQIGKKSSNYIFDKGIICSIYKELSKLLHFRNFLNGQNICEHIIQQNRYMDGHMILNATIP